MNMTLDIVFGDIVKVLVADKVAVLVTLKYMALAGELVACPTVAVDGSSASLGKQANVAKLKASPIKLRLVFVLVPQVPLSSPVVISFKTKSLS